MASISTSTSTSVPATAGSSSSSSSHSPPQHKPSGQSSDGDLSSSISSSARSDDDEDALQAPARSSVRNPLTGHERSSTPPSPPSQPLPVFSIHPPPSLPSLPATPATPAPPSPDIVLSRWQPDAEATLCPICHAQFSIFVRKHHCRYVRSCPYPRLYHCISHASCPVAADMTVQEMRPCCLQFMFAPSDYDSATVYCPEPCLRSHQRVPGIPGEQPWQSARRWWRARAPLQSLRPGPKYDPSAAAWLWRFILAPAPRKVPQQHYRPYQQPIA